MSMQDEAYDTEQELEAAILLIEEQDKQIAAMKAALISGRAYIHSANIIKTQPMDGCFIGMAKESLAREMPWINWEETKCQK
jgi:hypothetical protein